MLTIKMQKDQILVAFLSYNQLLLTAMNSAKTPFLTYLADDNAYHIQGSSQQFVGQLTRCLAGTRPKHLSLLTAIEDQLRNLSKRSVYATFKYMIVLHEALQGCTEEVQLMGIRNLLTLIELPSKSDKYQEYIRVKLLTPYWRYLIKWTEIRLSKSKLNSSSQCWQQIVFLQFNLLLFTTKSFSSSFKEFNGFLTKFYPVLTKYLQLMANDVYGMLVDIEKTHLEDMLGPISFLQVEQLRSNLTAFLPKQKEISQKTGGSTGQTCGQYSPINFRQIQPFDNLEGTVAAFL